MLSILLHDGITIKFLSMHGMYIIIMILNHKELGYPKLVNVKVVMHGLEFI